MRDVARDPDEVDRTLADRLIRDLNIAAPCIPGLGGLHLLILGFNASQSQTECRLGIPFRDGV